LPASSLAPRPIASSTLDSQFVAAAAADQVGLRNDVPDTAGDDRQHLVADTVPVPVVQQPEVVEIDEQQRAALALGVRARKQAGGALVEGLAIHELGQAVDGRESLDPLLREHLFVDEVFHQPARLLPGTALLPDGGQRRATGHQPHHQHDEERCARHRMEQRHRALLAAGPERADQRHRRHHGEYADQHPQPGGVRAGGEAARPLFIAPVPFLARHPSSS